MQSLAAIFILIDITELTLFSSIYRVKSESYKVLKTKERWPYYVEGENLTPYYGEQWQKYNITISELLKEVNGIFNATPSGKNSYGSLMRGADKLQITPEYGQRSFVFKTLYDSDFTRYFDTTFLCPTA